MNRFLWICLGGAAGTGARYLLSVWAFEKFGPAFPWGTFAVNVLGSFCAAALVQAGAAAMSPTLRMALTVGVMGGFTTYSTFNTETIWYAQGGDWRRAFANVAATLVACLAAGFAGAALGRSVFGG